MKSKKIDDEFPFLKFFGWIWNTLVHQAIAVVTVYVVWVAAFKYNAPHSLHVIFATFGYMPLMVESIMLFANDNVWTQDLTRKTKFWIHGILITIAVIFATAGISIRIQIKEDRGSAHFTSTHGITGLASMILVLLSLILGLVAGNANSLRGYARPVWFKFCHLFLATAGYILGIVSLCFGFHYLAREEPEKKIVLICVTSLATAWSLRTAAINCFNHIKAILGI